MIKVVFDTNVLVSAVLSNKGTAHKLVSLCAEGKITGYTSKAILDEFAEAVRRDFEVPLERAEQMIDVFLLFFKLVEPDKKLEVVKTDPNDNKIFECAEYANAGYIASWDSHVTSVEQYDEIKVMNPGKLLQELKEVHGVE